ncbi:MAG: hydroxymethylbilane synthase [Thermoguttaceae bacterium]|nr:hydroxymethylbilane synthase [Thermoguttaceae bacterium]
MKPLRLGTRPSALALWQANWTRDALEANGVPVEIVKIHTKGDVDRNSAIVNLGAQGVFTKEIQRALLLGEIDLAVHSLKDLPVERIDGLRLTAVPVRADFRDAFVSNRFATLDELPPGAVVATSSMRRQSQLLRRSNGAWDVRPVRGNVETRLKKLDDGEFDAMILASAGLNRLGFGSRIRHFLERPDFLPAVGQGALGLETRADDAETIARVAPLADEATFLSVLAERSLLATLQGGCLVPIGALGSLSSSTQTAQPSQNAENVQNSETAQTNADARQTLRLDAQILSFDGKTAFQTVATQTFDAALADADKQEIAEQLGRDAAQTLLDQGASDLVAEIRRIRDERAGLNAPQN